MWALDADTGAVIWQVQLSTIFGLSPGTVVSRTTPAVQRDTVSIGTQAGPDYTPQGSIGAQSGANLLAFNAKTGDLRWMLQLDTQKVAGLTASPAILEDVIHIGVSGVAQEVGVADDAVPCCSFIGSEVAVNVRTQKILWKTPMAPSGYTGTSVWGSNAVVDAQRKSVFIGTGNNYSTPTAPAYVQCISAGGKPEDCLSRDDHVDSIVALDTRNGRIKWSQRLTNGDDWNVACNKSPVGKNCPMPQGVDFDFGSAPNEISVRLPKAHGHQDEHHDERREIIGAGQKSGMYSAFDPDTGDFLWGTQVGPGGTLGGIEWGSATDGERIYVAIANNAHLPYENPDRPQLGTAGSWSALDPTNKGAIVWQTPDPNGAPDIAR